jgi:hypothetical protein
MAGVRRRSDQRLPTGTAGMIRSGHAAGAAVATTNFCFSEFSLDLFLIFRNTGPHPQAPFRGTEGAAPLLYFVVMIDYGRRGREAVVDPEITRREVISRVASGEYKNISFIHEVDGSTVDDITAEILAEAALPDIPAADADLQADHFDHARDLRKHETV